MKPDLSVFNYPLFRSKSGSGFKVLEQGPDELIIQCVWGSWSGHSGGEFVDCQYFTLALDQLAEMWHYMTEWSLPLRRPLAGTLRRPCLIARSRLNGAKREAIATREEKEKVPRKVKCFCNICWRWEERSSVKREEEVERRWGRVLEEDRQELQESVCVCEDSCTAAPPLLHLSYLFTFFLTFFLLGQQRWVQMTEVAAWQPGCCRSLKAFARYLPVIRSCRWCLRVCEPGEPAALWWEGSRVFFPCGAFSLFWLFVFASCCFLIDEHLILIS